MYTTNILHKILHILHYDTKRGVQSAFTLISYAYCCIGHFLRFNWEHFIYIVVCQTWYRHIKQTKTNKHNKASQQNINIALKHANSLILVMKIVDIRKRGLYNNNLFDRSDLFNLFILIVKNLIYTLHILFNLVS